MSIDALSAYVGQANAWLEGLHPHMQGIDVVQLASVLVLSWLGGMAITRGRRS